MALPGSLRVCFDTQAWTSGNFEHAFRPHLDGGSIHRRFISVQDEVVAETSLAMETAKELGSILVGASNQIVAQTPVENIDPLVDTIEAMR